MRLWLYVCIHLGVVSGDETREEKSLATTEKLAYSTHLSAGEEEKPATEKRSKLKLIRKRSQSPSAAVASSTKNWQRKLSYKVGKIICK